VQVEELIALGKIGYVRGIASKLAALKGIAPAAAPVLTELDEYARTFQFHRYLNRLESLRQHGN